MLKIMLYLVVVAVFLIGLAASYHIYKVSKNNKAEMARFEAQTPMNANFGKVLVVFYSLSGHTKDIAIEIAQKTNADIYEIKTKKTYTSPSVYTQSKKELTQKQYPLLEGDLPDISPYDIVFVGGPVWWYTMAPALYSFLRNINFSGKRVVPFSTQGSNYGTFFEDFASNAQNAKILTGENFNNISEKYRPQVSNKINVWLNNL